MALWRGRTKDHVKLSPNEKPTLFPLFLRSDTLSARRHPGLARLNQKVDELWTREILPDRSASV